MADKPKPRSSEAVDGTRRDLVRSSAQVAMTAPAVALLHNPTKPAAAQVFPYVVVDSFILDDFTFGNTHEDFDAIALRSNFDPINQTPQLDDRI